MSNIKITPKQFNKITLATQFGEYLYSRLPKVYRDYDVKIERKNVETQQIETFRTLEEYLKSFALGGFQPLLEDLEAIINLVDPLKCPAQFLPYLLRHFGLDYIDDIPEKFQRRLVQNVVTLYKKKGTIPAVAFLARELSGFGVTIEEKSDGTIEFALVKLNAYEDEDAELLLAQDVVQRYIHLFLPARASSKIIVVYGFTENVHINAPEKAEEDGFDHAYYNVDEVVGTITIDENGYEDVDGGYSESFNYLNHVVENDFESLKLQLEEELQNFQPRIPDLTSLTNLVENDGLPVFTNGISCEDIIKTGTVTLSATSNELSVPTTSGATIESITASGKSAVLPICKYTTDLHRGDVLKFTTGGESGTVWGYLKLDYDLYACETYPTTFQIDIYNKAVKIYNHYFTETIDGSYDFKEYTGYSRFYTITRNGSSDTDYPRNKEVVRVKCDCPNKIVVGRSIYNQPSTVNVEVIPSDYSHCYISLKNTITSVEKAKEFVTKYPITIIAPASRSSNCDTMSGHTISYKWLSDSLDIEGVDIISINCESITMSDRRSVFSYESPCFIQQCQLGVQNKKTKEWNYYDLGMPLISFDGYNESIEKHNGKYYLKSAIKEIGLDFIYNHKSVGGGSGVGGYSKAGWFIYNDNKCSSSSKGIPLYFNMSPCASSVKALNTGTYENGVTTYFPNSHDVWDFFSIKTYAYTRQASFEINQLRTFCGYQMRSKSFKKYVALWNDIFKHSDIPPKIYIHDTTGYFGGETLEEITDPVVINKLNLLPIPEECVIINSKGTGFAQIELSINSKVYY